jgi:hypothetical protein
MTMHAAFVDAAPRRAGSVDPTGTTRIRIAFRAEAARRLNAWKQLVRIALLNHDVFGHSEYRAGKDLPVEHAAAPAPRAFAWLAPGDKLTAFADWLEKAWDDTVVRPQWWTPHIKRALIKGLRTAEHETKPSGRRYGQLTALMLAQTDAEVRGIGAAAIQVVTRLVGDHVHRKTSPLLTYRDVSRVIDKIAGNRLEAMVNTQVVKAYNRIKIAAYRDIGITHVGIIPERRLVKRDAARSLRDHVHQAQIPDAPPQRRKPPPPPPEPEEPDEEEEERELFPPTRPQPVEPEEAIEPPESGLHRILRYGAMGLGALAAARALRGLGGAEGAEPDEITAREPGLEQVEAPEAPTAPPEGIGAEQVNWTTAGDDLVCIACEDMADGSPYPIEEVEDMIPLHPNCRCSLTPATGGDFEA